MKKLYFLILLLVSVLCACNNDDEPTPITDIVSDEVQIDGEKFYTSYKIDDEGNRIFHCWYYYYQGRTYMRLIAFENPDNIIEYGQYIIHLNMDGKIKQTPVGTDLTSALQIESMKYFPSMVSSIIDFPPYLLKPHAGKITLVDVNSYKVVVQFEDLALYSYYFDPNDKRERSISGTISFYGPEDPKELWPDEEW